tara:strand:+ start:28403 stop:29281 length:879 start_codon:yes stop_codon:yes gene_type:complete
MNSLLNSFQKDFKEGTILHKLIYTNTGLFFLFSIIEVFSYLFLFDIKPILNKLYLPANNNILINQPWTFITYMFLHGNFLHLLFNMLWLHFGGKIFLRYLQPKQLLAVYILGGISGGLLFILAFNYVPALQALTLDARAVGASASVLAIMVAIATYSPNYSVRLPFIGTLTLKKIAIGCIALDILSIPNGNAGGHIAHLGGAFFGYFYIKQLQKGKDYSEGLSKLIDRLINTFKTKNKLRTVHKKPRSDYEFNSDKIAKQKEIDKILERIAKSGYESLSKEEKATLFSASKK